MFKKTLIVALFALIPLSSYAYTSPLEILKILQARLDSITLIVDSLKQTAQVGGAFTNSKTPIASYAFDEGTGTTISDKSGNGNTGNLMGGASWSTGKYGNAVSIVSDGQKVIVQTSPQTEIVGSFTLEAWIKPNSLPNSYNPIIIKASGYPSNYSYFLQGNKLMWKWAGSSDYFYSSATVQANVWQHVAISYDAVAQRWTHYINGVASGSGAETRAPEAYTGPLYIGSNDGSGFFPGTIDDIRIYNTALTASEIQADMNSPVGGTTATTPIVTTPTPTTPTPASGTCGTSNGTTLSSSPTTNLCGTGTASSVTNSSSYTWSCAGTNGGTTASCSAGKVVATPVVPVVAAPAVIGGTAKLASFAASLLPGQWTILNNDGDPSGYNWNLLVACTAPNNSGDCGDTIINYADKGLWDPNTKEMHFLGAGHLRAWKFITYTASTDNWFRQPKPYFDCRETESLCWPMGHGYEHSTINPETGDIYWRGFSSSEMYRWTKSTQTWAPIESSSNPNPTIVGALAYFPEMGGLLFIGGGKVHFFNETTNTWSQLAANLPMAEYHNVATYDPINKIVIFGGGNDSPKLHKINASGVITAIADAPAAVGVNSSVFTVDPASGKYLLFTWAGTFHEYNVTTNTWSNLNSNSVPIWNTGAQNKSEFRVAIPISTYGVIAIMGYNPRTVWLYKHSSSGAVPVTAPTTPVTTPTNGSCGTSNGTTLSSSPTTNLCGTGTASSVTNSSSYTWSCAGTSGGTTASCSASKTVATIPVTPVTPLPIPVVSGTSITNLKLNSPTAGTKAFTVGQVLREGDLPNGYYVSSSDAAIQSEIKNRWPDGSAKFAILSGQVSLTSNVDKIVSLVRTTTAPNGTALTLASLKATGVTASIGYGSYGTASWLNTDWDFPFKTLSQGPVMSSWTYRKPVGSDAHLVAWIEVRLYQNGSVEVVPWLENGYLRVAAPGERNGTASFTLGGTERFSSSLNLLNHQRAYLGNGTTLSHWLGGDPQVTPKHNVDYMMATKMVPNYKADSTNSSALFGRLSSAYTPLAQANYPAGMGTAGYHSSIGILPEWDAAFFTTNADPRAYRAVLINAYAAGRFGVHFRDEATNLPIRFSGYPNLVVGGGSSIGSSGASNTGEQTPNSTGATPPTYNSSHHPSMGYLAYLLTGRQYFLEELQFVATLNFLKNSDSARANSKGVFLTTAGANTTRGAAWSIRTLAQAAAATPDNDSLRTEFVNSLNENIKYYEGRYVAQPTNPLGLVEPYSNYNGINVDPHSSSIWMDDFFTMSFGYLKDLKAYSTSLQNKVDDFTVWKYKSIIGRLGGSGDDQYSYRYVGQYTVNYAPKNNPDYNTGAGPWYSSWGAVARSMNKGTSGEIGESIVDGYPEEATGYVSNMLPALSYAVEHGAAGAGAAWTRFSSASNFNAHIALYKNDPVWSVYPRTLTSVPAPAPTQVSGVCGISNSTTLTSLPTTNLCAEGTASGVTNSSSYTWSCAGSNGGASVSCSAYKPTATPTPSSPSSKFTMNSRVETTSQLNVRSTPNTSGALLGTQAPGVSGVVIGGAVAQGGYTWWNINFDAGVDGWSAEDYLTSRRAIEPVVANPTSNASGGGGGGKTTEVVAVVTSAPSTPSLPPVSAGIGTNKTATYTRNLKVGDRGEDVRHLQQFLNQRGFLIASSGGGSLGNETTYFGVATMRALQAFQNSFRSELVTPFGEKTGTGFFGAATKAKVQALEAAAPPTSTLMTAGDQESTLALIQSLLAQLQLLQAELNRLKGI